MCGGGLLLISAGMGRQKTPKLTRYRLFLLPLFLHLFLTLAFIFCHPFLLHCIKFHFSPIPKNNIFYSNPQVKIGWVFRFCHGRG
jgi:hypothetical protein